jgi:restriction endonuclease S subunit
LKESFLSSGRLDAEYYQSKYDEIEREIASYYDALEIGNLCFVNQKNTKPKDGVRYKYIELSNINTIGEITGCTIDYGENLPTRARQVVKTGDVIVSSIEGSLDSCALVIPEYDNAFCSTGFYIIRSKIITSETLLVLMKLKPIQQLLKKGCSGTILTAINYDNFCNIIIPVPDGKIQTEISAKIQRCFALKAESKCLLEEAKKMVENEIEKGGE